MRRVSEATAYAESYWWAVRSGCGAGNYATLVLAVEAGVCMMSEKGVTYIICALSLLLMAQIPTF